jgi:hypothetical protein
MTDTTGQIVDLDEEKIYDIDAPRQDVQGDHVRGCAAANRGGAPQSGGRSEQAAGQAREGAGDAAAAGGPQLQADVSLKAVTTARTATLTSDARQLA